MLRLSNYRLLAVVDKVVRVASIVFVVAAGLLLVYAAMCSLGWVVRMAVFSAVLRYALLFSFIVMVIGSIVQSVNKLWRNDELDDDDLEYAVERAVERVMTRQQEASRQHVSGDKCISQSTASLLLSLTDDEQAVVCSLLKELPDNATKPGHIHLAITARYLTALSEMGYLNDLDRGALRLWIADVTGKQVPAVSQFNEAYPSNNKSKVREARQRIEKCLAKVKQ